MPKGVDSETWRKVDQEAVAACERHLEAHHHLHSAALLAAANAIVFTDLQGRILWVNPAFTTLTGYTAEEVLGQNTRMLRSGKQDPAFYRELWATILAGQVWHGEIINRRKDGSLYTEEMTVTPVRDGKGEVAYFIAIKQDVTRRKEAEEALLRQQRVLDAISDNILAHVAYLDRDFNIVHVNATYAQGSGYRAEELVGRNHFDLFPNEENQRIFERVRDTGEPYIARAKPFEYGNQPERGTTYWDWWLRPIRSPEGETEGMVLSLVDVTPTERARREVERLNAELRAADQRKDEFLAMLGHELRNPLAAVLNAARLLQLQETTDPAGRRAVEAIARQTQHMAKLLDDLLDVSRVTHGKIALQKERVDFGRVVAQAVQASSPLIEERRHELSIAVPPEPLWLEADPDRLQQVISNLLTNAAKYTAPGGQIWLSLAREGEDAVLRVRDNGVGIALELLPRIFDLFVQAERTPDRAQGGMGIGLTMVRDLVQAHGGSVVAHSDGPGRGSEFVVRLPAPTALAAAQPVNDLIQQANHPGCRILLVDDNADAGEMLAALLEMDGHEVVMAQSGPAALARLADTSPDVILLDIGLPGMDGYEVARHIRGRADLRDVLLVAVTGYGQAHDRQRTARAGFDHHLTKPVDLAHLRQILSQVAECSRRPSCAGTA